MLKILIVDDEKHARDGLSAVLEAMNLPMMVQTAEDGLEGLEKARLIPPDILISDIRMPKCDGLAMLKRMQESGISIPRKYLLTGYSEFAYAQQAIHYGVSEYILKPVTPQSLTQLIQRDASNLPKIPTNISLDGRRLMLVSDEANPAVADFVQKQNYTSVIAASVYMGEQLHLPDDIKAELLRRQDIYVVTVADRHYRGILAGLRTQTAEAVLYSLRMLLTSAEGLTLCHTTATPFGVTDWHALFDTLSRAIPWSLTLGSRFFALDEAQTTRAQPPADDSVYRARLHKLYARGDYNACHEWIVQRMQALCNQHRPPEEICLQAAASLYKLNLDCGSNPAAMEALHLQTTNRIATAKNQQELLAALADYFAFAAETPLAAGYSRPVSMALQDIHRRYAQPLTLQNIAGGLKITPQYLNRLFAKELNLTFNDYLTKYRLDKACQMLRHGGLRINQIGQSVGYPDAKYFCTLFKRELGVTPGQYRGTGSGA